MRPSIRSSARHFSFSFFCSQHCPVVFKILFIFNIRERIDKHIKKASETNKYTIRNHTFNESLDRQKSDTNTMISHWLMSGGQTESTNIGDAKLIYSVSQNDAPVHIPLD